jgi:hypothetical protein
MSRSRLRGLMSCVNVSAGGSGGLSRAARALAYLQRLLAGLELKTGRTTTG